MHRHPRGLRASARPRIACVERLWKGSDGGLSGILLLAHNWADWVATKRSYKLMGRYVHPQFQRDANALRQWGCDDAKSKYETAGVASRAAVQAAIDKYQAGKNAQRGRR